MEDVENVRATTARVLRAQGYIVLEAADSTEALRLAQEYDGQAIDLLLTDMVMPRMNGVRLAERLRQSWPQLKVLFISGYTDVVIVNSNPYHPGSAFLAKPYSPAALAQKVREVLDL